MHLLHLLHPKLFGENEWELFTGKILVAGGVSQTATADDTAFIVVADRPNTHRKTRESSTRNDDGPGAPSRVTVAPPAALAAAGTADTTTGSSRY